MPESDADSKLPENPRTEGGPPPQPAVDAAKGRPAVVQPAAPSGRALFIVRRSSKLDHGLTASERQVVIF